jgi:hypothetical protein
MRTGALFASPRTLISAAHAWPRLVSALRPDLAGVVPKPTTVPEHHEPRVLGSGSIRRGDWVPAATVRAVQLVAWLEWFVHATRVVRSMTTEVNSPRRGRENIDSA